jgi:hypothetical protein
MVFSSTCNTISLISWRSVLLVEETGRPGETFVKCILFFTLLFSELIITMALQYILAVGIHMAVAKELLTFCLVPHCKCDPVYEYATCSGLDFVPKIPDFVHNLDGV